MSWQNLCGVLKEGKSYEQLKKELGDVASPHRVTALVSFHTWIKKTSVLYKKIDPETDWLYILNDVNVQQQDSGQGQKKIFLPDELINKQAGELPEGVDPAEKEVSLCCNNNLCWFFVYGLDIAFFYLNNFCTENHYKNTF